MGFPGEIARLGYGAAAGKAAAGRQKKPQDFSSFLKHAGTQEPQRQATSFSSFIRQELLEPCQCLQLLPALCSSASHEGLII